MRWMLAACIGLCLGIAAWAQRPDIMGNAIAAPVNPPLLSAFGFFDGAASKPSVRLIPYRLRTPLFSDYAEKQRFLYLPSGSHINVDAMGRVALPVGAALVKSFGFRDTQGRLNIIETRLLLHRADGWTALPYVWRADGRDAELRIGGTRVLVNATKADGSHIAISYAVPNKNQCKQCHVTGDIVTPIGPVWQNMVFENAAAKQALFQRGSFPRTALAPEAAWDDPKSGTIDQRARSYLRVNCGHCHKPSGSASNSGLFFDAPDAHDLVAMGIGKRPVAAGRGAGDFTFVIEPGHPERSILIHRMKSTDPGVAMPELGRATVHDEGVALLEDWIRAMKR